MPDISKIRQDPLLLDKPSSSAIPEGLLLTLGKSVDQIDTPALVIELDAMERNLARMAEYANTQGVLWRPHAKMHKSSELAQLQMQAGAVGICVQKVSEAQAMVAGGVKNVYITNEVIAEPKLLRLAGLAWHLATVQGRIAIAVDSLMGIHRLAQALLAVGGAQSCETLVDVFVEIDVGHHRCGVPPGPSVLALAQEIGRHALLRFAGLQAYHGSAQHLRSARDRHDTIAAAVEHVKVARCVLESKGIAVGIVTGAGTGTFANEARSGVWNELQTGSFLFMDGDYSRNELDADQPHFEHALFVKSQVMSESEGHVVCDAGHKSHAIDCGMPLAWSPTGGPSGIEYFNGGDEHGVLRLTASGKHLPALGETVWLIPGHCDPTVNLYSHLIGIRGGLQQGTVERIIRVDARGALT